MALVPAVSGRTPTITTHPYTRVRKLFPSMATWRRLFRIAAIRPRVWYLAPAIASSICDAVIGSWVGNDSTGVGDDIDHPFESWNAIALM
jgi:hypothetical protein